MHEGNWLSRRWYDFRSGHSVYLALVLSFGNFVLIFHRLLLERLDWIEISLFWFVPLFFGMYVPIAMGMGMWHRKHQLKVETSIWMEQNPELVKRLDRLESKLDEVMGRLK